MRFQQSGHLHFITFSCYKRRPYVSDQLGSTQVIVNGADGHIEGESVFYPYGRERPLVTDTTGNTYKFTGQSKHGPCEEVLQPIATWGTAAVRTKLFSRKKVLKSSAKADHSETSLQQLSLSIQSSNAQTFI